jgi:SlyX protein
MTDARLDALEIRIAYQDEVIEDLNKTVASQWKEIDRLTREIANLGDRVTRAEQSGGADEGEEPPPPIFCVGGFPLSLWERADSSRKVRAG